MCGCPNCGSANYNAKDPCNECNYTQPEIVEKSSVSLTYCDECGCSYSEGCIQGHEDSNQRKIEIK
jgi:hypothetical protein